MEKGERGSNIIFLIILRLLGRISCGERGRDGFSEENFRFPKNGRGQEYKVVGNLYIPAISSTGVIVSESGVATVDGEVINTECEITRTNH